MGGSPRALGTSKSQEIKKDVVSHVIHDRFRDQFSLRVDISVVLGTVCGGDTHGPDGFRKLFSPLTSAHAHRRRGPLNLLGALFGCETGATSADNERGLLELFKAECLSFHERRKAPAGALRPSDGAPFDSCEETE
ncbi:hypothetical protein EVAR_90683_1 [Eumeta japonica]|uniref:Uncharacterized protein n=1 Tax=Eumeta variegata TaxID=151549 RepID=A0A4C1YZN4_EUMVA|nr:hypothetical protein EVAR_90683_1 [Eumeta japonica]